MKRAFSTALSILVGIFVLNSFVLAGDNPNHKTIKIDGMMCSACESKVKSALLEVDGVKTVEVSAKTGEAKVVLATEKVDLKKLYNAVSDAGFKPVSFDGKSACELGICNCPGGHKHDEATKKIKSKKSS